MSNPSSLFATSVHVSCTCVPDAPAVAVRPVGAAGTVGGAAGVVAVAVFE
jgi:hypothetical protein